MIQDYAISQKRVDHLAVVDAMPHELRACVHEFGLPIVNACLRYGVRKPAAIRDLVREIWAGARQTGQSGSAKNTIDWLLGQSAGIVSYATLEEVLRANNLAITPLTPTRAMIDASMGTVAGFDVAVTKREKHKRRLDAALQTLRRGPRP